MLLSWFLRFALFCGILLAPVAMTPACAHSHAASHAAHSQQGDPDHHEGMKSGRCGGTCSAIEVRVAPLPAPLLTTPRLAPAPNMSALPLILLDRDTPPPRRV